jgi:hypothetical protein
MFNRSQSRTVATYGAVSGHFASRSRRSKNLGRNCIGASNSCASNFPIHHEQLFVGSTILPIARPLCQFLFQLYSQTTQKMFRRQLLRQSRSLSKSLTELPQVRRSPFSSATFISSRASTSAGLPSRLQRRWQSTESDLQKSATEAAPPASEEAKSTEAKPEDAMKEELEKTKREVIDMKVRPPHLKTGLHSRQLICVNRTNTCAPSPTSATSKTARSATWTLPANSPSSASPPTSSTR